MKLGMKIAALGLVSLLVLAGCGNSGDKSSENDSSGQKDEKIILYSNSVNNGRGDFLKEKAEEKGFKVEIVDLAGNDLLNRVIAEKDSPIADVVFGMNQMMFSKVEEEEIFEAYKPIWLDKVDPSLVDKDNKYSPLQEQRVFMIYDANKINPENAVKDWQDLASNSDLKGKYIVPKGLGGATANAVVYNILMNYQDEKGENGISKEGWSEVEKFFKNGVAPSEGQSEVAELANGKVDYSYTWLSNIPIVEESLGIKLGVVNPPYGAPQTIEQVGIIKKDKMNPKVKDFVDFLGSVELQSEWAQKFGAVPVNQDAQGSVNPRIAEILNETDSQDNDYDFINKHLDQWVEYIELNVLGN